MTEIINFKAGQYVISFEILNILMTEKYEDNASKVPSGDNTLLGIINYQNNPTPIYDLSLILEGSTSRQRMKDLIDLLNAREQDHVDWVDALGVSIEQDKPFTKAKDPTQCAFGRWYSEFSSENSDLMHMLRKFDEPHKEIHALADELLAVAQSEGKDVALEKLNIARNTTLVSLRKLFAAARESVTSSHKPVIVYTTLNGTTPCFGFLVDSVDDTLTITDSDIESFDNNSAITFAGNLNLPSMISGMVTKNNINSLLIDPSKVKTDIPTEEPI